MKISEAIRKLQEIQSRYGDLTIAGGNLTDDIALRRIAVADAEGREIYPRDPNGARGKSPIQGVFLE